ncbi:MAG: DUF6702 family protein [Gemmatimonadales bacterium]
MIPQSAVLAHPLHTSLTEMSYDAKGRTLDLSVRVFVDDFTAAAKLYRGRRAANGAARQPPLVSYALAMLTLTDARGRLLPLVSCGGKRVGDLMWLCFRARLESGPEQLAVSSRILFDKYKDQINVVQVTYGGKKLSILFTPGDGAKRIS